MDARKLARLCWELADQKKAEAIIILDVRKISSITDYFVLATGTSEPHLRAIVETITEKLWADHALQARAVDGGTKTPWVVLDYNDVVVHVMRSELRQRYDLEGLWGDAVRVRFRRPATHHPGSAKSNVSSLDPH
jgi:ribosome-associated protein